VPRRDAKSRRKGKNGMSGLGFMVYGLGFRVSEPQVLCDSAPDVTLRLGHGRPRFLQHKLGLVRKSAKNGYTRSIHSGWYENQPKMDMHADYTRGDIHVARNNRSKAIADP
jgi:hypothetical protein